MLIDADPAANNPHSPDYVSFEEVRLAKPGVTYEIYSPRNAMEPVGVFTEQVNSFGEFAGVVIEAHPIDRSHQLNVLRYTAQEHCDLAENTSGVWPIRAIGQIDKEILEDRSAFIRSLIPIIFERYQLLSETPGQIEFSPDVIDLKMRLFASLNQALIDGTLAQDPNTGSVDLTKL